MKKLSILLLFGKNKPFSGKYATEIVKIVENAKKIKPNIPSKNPSRILENFREDVSLADEVGPVLFSDDGKIYRGIFPNKVEYIKRLLATGAPQALAEAGYLPKCEITNFYTEKFPMILEMEKLRIYPADFFSFKMFFDAGMTHLIINEVLSHFGFYAWDTQALNCTTKNNHAVLFDIGSSISDRHFNSHAFTEGFLKPLIMAAMGKGNPINYLNPDDFAWAAAYKKFKKYHNSSKQYLRILKDAERCKGYTADNFAFLFENYSKSDKWSKYQEKAMLQQKTDARREIILDLAAKYAPDAKTALDFAGSSGYFANLLIKTGQFSRVSVVDNSSDAIDLGYSTYKDIDFYCTNPMYGGLEQKLAFMKSDIVFALAVTHHLLLAEHYHLDAILRRIAQYSNKYVFIEFCPLGLWGGGDVLPKVPEWYTEKYFEDAFRNNFDFLDKQVVAKVKIGDKTLPHRILFIGKKRN
jgi:hypothetical protein